MKKDAKNKYTKNPPRLLRILADSFLFFLFLHPVLFLGRTVRPFAVPLQARSYFVIVPKSIFLPF